MMFTLFLNCLTAAGINYMTDKTAPKEMNLFISKDDRNKRAFCDALHEGCFSLIFGNEKSALYGTISGYYLTVYTM